jgi:hypothetical protein
MGLEAELGLEAEPGLEAELVGVETFGFFFGGGRFMRKSSQVEWRGASGISMLEK